MGEPGPNKTSPRLLVTMFTDLVGSTALKEHIGVEAYRAMLDRHDSFLSFALLNVGLTGRILQDNGDGYFLAFESVYHAVATALLFQWLMHIEPWPHPFVARVGLHLGEVDHGTNLASGDVKVIGSAIDLASRVMSLAEGGQILMSRAVFEPARLVVRVHPSVPGSPPASLAQPSQLRWVAHGPYLFKGSSEPIEIFEVGAESLASFNPPPDSEKAKRHRAMIHSGLSKHTLVGHSGHRRGRMILSLIAGALVLLGAGLGAWISSRSASNPVAEMRRREIQREVDLARAEPPSPIREPAVGVKAIDAFPSFENPAYQVLSDRRIVDLRAWKEVPEEKLGELYSPITTNRRLSLRKISRADRFEQRWGTSGLDLMIRAVDSFPMDLQILRRDEFVGGQRLKFRVSSHDVSSVPVGAEFELNTVGTAWNSAQTDQEQWQGLIGYKNSFAVSMLLLFPAARPCKNFRLTVAPTSKDAESDYTGPRIILLGQVNDWIYWEVPNPEAGHVYRIDWTW